MTPNHPDWSRHKLTKHICTHWEWRTDTGQLKTFAARSMIDKLERQGFLDLPPIRTTLRRKPRSPFPKGFIAPALKPIEKPLGSLTPLSIQIPMKKTVSDII